MLRVVTQATVEPVTLAEAKTQLGVIHDSDDEMIADLITAAREIVERQTGYALAAAGYEWTPVGDRREPLPIWPGEVTSAADAYPILFTAAPGDPPRALKRAILLALSDLYVSRESNITGTIVAENPTFQNLIFPFRRVLP